MRNHPRRSRRHDWAARRSGSHEILTSGFTEPRAPAARSRRGGDDAAQVVRDRDGRHRALVQVQVVLVTVVIGASDRQNPAADPTPHADHGAEVVAGPAAVPREAVALGEIHAFGYFTTSAILS